MILSGLIRPAAASAAEPGRGVGDLGPAAVVDAHRSVSRSLCRVSCSAYLQLADDAAPQPRPAAGPADPHAQLVHLVAAAVDHVAVEAHQEPDLVGRAPPVLGGERVRGDVRDAELQRALDHVEQRRLAGRVPGGAGQAARLRPPAVAVHDDRDVPRHRLRRERRRPRPGRVRRRRAVRAARLALLASRSLAGRSTSGSERSPRSRCHCRCAATRPLASRRVAAGAGLGAGPVAVGSAAISVERHRRRVGRAGRPAVRADRCRRPAPRTPGAGRASRRRAHSRSAGAQPANDIARSRYASSTRPAGVLAVGQRPQRAERQQEQPQRRLLLLGRQPLGGLGDRRSPRCSAGSRRGSRCRSRSMPSTWLTMSQRAALEQLHVDVAERLQPGAEPRRGAPHALGDRAHPAVPAGEQRDDPVGLAQLLHAQHHRVVAVEPASEPRRHTAIVPRTVRSPAGAAASGRAASPWRPVRAGRGRPGCRAASSICCRASVPTSLSRLPPVPDDDRLLAVRARRSTSA